MSYLEIYNEQVNDLLAPGNNNLKIKEDELQGVTIQDLTSQQVFNFEEVLILMNYGEEHRAYRETSIHEHSSRSHTLFKIYIESCIVSGGSDLRIRFGCLNLVDLAGSERLSEPEYNAGKAGEISHINKSLFVLAHVVNKLAEAKNKFIHYRDSKLTRILSIALGGNSLCCVVCTVSPAAINFSQTLSTLRFASTAKRVKNSPKLNEVFNEVVEVTEFKREISKLHYELKEAMTDNFALEEGTRELNKQLKACQEELRAKNGQITQYRDASDREKELLEQFERALEQERHTFSSQKRALLEQHQELLDKYSEEQRVRTKIEYDLENHRQVLIETIRSEHGTLKNLNELIIGSGGTPVDIPHPAFPEYEVNRELNYIDSLLYSVDVDRVPSENLAEWTDQTRYLSNSYRLDLVNIQNQYRDKLKRLASESFPET